MQKRMANACKRDFWTLSSLANTLGFLEETRPWIFKQEEKDYVYKPFA